MTMQCQCGNAIPSRILVDGKHRLISRRTRCLTCSPFAPRNLKRPDGTMTERGCPKCGKAYAHKGAVCNSCRVVDWRKNIKRRLVDYKGGKCQSCGYDRCLDNLTFHHTDPAKKEFTISGMCRAYESLLKEVDKCQLLCRNCHGEVHAGIIHSMNIGDTVNIIFVDFRDRTKTIGTHNAVIRAINADRTKAKFVLTLEEMNTALKTDVKSPPHCIFTLDMKDIWNSPKGAFTIVDHLPNPTPEEFQSVADRLV
jgi:hypothetical protein